MLVKTVALLATVLGVIQGTSFPPLQHAWNEKNVIPKMSPPYMSPIPEIEDDSLPSDMAMGRKEPSRYIQRYPNNFDIDTSESLIPRDEYPHIQQAEWAPHEINILGRLVSKDQYDEFGGSTRFNFNERNVEELPTDFEYWPGKQCPYSEHDRWVDRYKSDRKECSDESYCTVSYDEQTWHVLQVRKRDTAYYTEFNKSFVEYERGFGNLQSGYWLGLDCLHELTTGQSNSLLIELTDLTGNMMYASYSSFSVGDASTGYILSLGGYYGTTTSNPLRKSNGMRFTTYDRDYDLWATKNCAAKHAGGWWFKLCQRNAPNAYLNSWFTRGYQRKPMGLQWHPWKTNNPVVKTRMLFRPNNRNPLYYATAPQPTG